MKRRSFLKGIVAAAGALVLPATLEDNAEATRRVFALDSTMVPKPSGMGFDLGWAVAEGFQRGITTGEAVEYRLDPITEQLRFHRDGPQLTYVYDPSDMNMRRMKNERRPIRSDRVFIAEDGDRLVFGGELSSRQGVFIERRGVVVHTLYEDFPERNDRVIRLADS